MNPNRTRTFFIFILLVVMMVFPLAGAEPDPSNDTVNVTLPILTVIPDTAGPALVNESVNVTENWSADNCTADFPDSVNCTGTANQTASENVHPAAAILKAAKVYPTLPPGDAPAEAQDYDHYVSFRMRANALAPNNAYDLVNRGEVSDSTLWVYNMYLFGLNSDGQNGRIQVYANSGAHKRVSPLSVPLSPGTEYLIVWRYSNTAGGELFINGVSQGSPVGSGALNISASSSFHVGENMYNDGGRQHSAFNGDIWDVYDFEKDLEPVVYTYSISNAKWDDQHNDWDKNAITDCEKMKEIFNGLGWKQAFPYKQGDEVTKGLFGVNPDQGEHTLNKATLHYHNGHGGLYLNDKTQSFIWLLNPDHSGYPLASSEITQKWGGENKWVILSSCSVLRGSGWKNVLGTTHGILGFNTTTYAHPEFMATFVEYAKTESVLQAYFDTTRQLFGETRVTTADGKVKGERVTAIAYFGNSIQAENDYLPGMVPGKGIQQDALPTDPIRVYQWPPQNEVTAV